MKYTETHEWIHAEGNQGRVGISNFAQKELGEIVYVEFPEVGKTVKAGDEVAVLESTKAAADIYSPVSGVITKVNEAMRDDPSPINTSPEEAGWIYEIELTDESELESFK